MSGVSLAAFALTSEYVGSFALAMVLMVVLGVFTTGFTTGTQSSLQMMVPDEFRGRVMGFYGMTYNLRPLGGVQASALASIGILGAPFALAIGGSGSGGVYGCGWGLEGGFEEFGWGGGRARTRRKPRTACSVQGAFEVGHSLFIPIRLLGLVMV